MNKQAFITEGKQANRLSIVEDGNTLTLCYDRADLYRITYKTPTQRRQALSLLNSLYN